MKGTYFPLLGNFQFLHVHIFWVPTAIRQPKGLRLGLEPAIGDPGCCVHVTNYGPVEHYISRVGAMPARLRPRWSVCTKRINPKGDLLEPLLVETASASIDRTIEPGCHRSFLVPQQSDEKLRGSDPKSQRVVIERYNSWLKKDQPGGPLPLVPYVLLGDGSVVLGKKARVQPPPQCLAQVPLCACGHAITQHALRQRTRLAPSMTVYGRVGSAGAENMPRVNRPAGRWRRCTNITVPFWLLTSASPDVS